MKLDVNGQPTRYKARWCARGDRQKQGIDFQETYAAVARAVSFWGCLAICAEKGLLCHLVDSQPAMAIACSEGYRARTKQIDVRYHYI